MSLGKFRDATEFFGNADVQNQIKGFGDTMGFLKDRGSVFLTCYEKIQSSCEKFFSLIKFDSIMNFFQQIGLWFTSLKFPEGFERAFQKFMDFVSLIWTFISSITDLEIFYIWSCIEVTLFVIWLIIKIWDPVLELKGPNSYGWEKRGKLFYWVVYLMVEILVVLFLPCITACFNVIFCYEGLMVPYELECYHGMHWLHLCIAIFVFLFIGLYLPFQIFFVIRTYQPKPHQYDSSGQKLVKGFDEEEITRNYQDLLKRDQCPYKFLYAGYEYGWSLYKVITMIFKMVIIIPTIPFFTSTVGTASASLVIVTIYGLISIISSPFLLPSDDWIEITARLTAVLTLCVQICILCKVIHEPYSSRILITLNVACLVVIFLIILFSMNFVKNLIRKYFGRLHYSTGLVYNDTLARKTRIWQRFWRSLFKSRELYVDVEKRMQELVDICTKEGITNFRNDLFVPNDAIKQARKLSFFLEGPDCYFRSDSVKDPTCWGRMFINLFPFQLTIIYDVSEKSVIIDDEIVCEFVNQNKQNDILLSRKFRQMLRCLRDERVNYKFSEIVPIKTACGKKERLVDFQSGILRIKQKCNDPFSHGFKVRLELDDGKYIDDDGTEVTGIKYTAKEADLRITSDFSQTPELLQLFNSNKEIIDAKWPEIQQRLTWMHDDLMEFRQEQLEVLSNVFYMMVCNNDKIPRAEMESFLTKYEQNPTVQNIPELERLNLDGLYDRLKFYDGHPAFAFWYNFFDDIAVRNSVIKKISTNADLFDMSAGTALAYHPMPVEKLKEILESRGLRTKKGGGLFNDKVMNLFEEKLNAACNNAPVPETEIKVSSMSENLMTDPLMIGTPLVTENTTYLATAAMTAFTGS